MNRLKEFKTPDDAIEAWYAAGSPGALNEWLGCTADEWNRFQNPAAFRKAKRKIDRIMKTMRRKEVKQRPNVSKIQARLRPAPKPFDPDEYFEQAKREVKRKLKRGGKKNVGPKSRRPKR